MALASPIPNIAGEGGGEKRIVLDELGILLVLFSAIWLTLGLILFQNNPAKSKYFTMILLFLLFGFFGSFAFGLRPQREFTVANMFTAIFLSLPLLIIGAMSVLSSPYARFDTVATAFNMAVATAEELFFRGFVFLLTKKILPRIPLRTIAVYITNGILFAIYHTVSYGFDFYAMIFPLVAAIYFCMIVDATKRISYPMIIHAIWNILQATAGGGVSPI